jgi:hypothetical protein
MGWTEVAAGLGTNTAIAGLKAARDQMSKRQYKRLLATAVAQILELHPDLKPAKARRRAQRVTGARPSKKLMRPADNIGWKEGAEGAVAAAATAGVAKVAGIFGNKLREKFSADEEMEERDTTAVESAGDNGQEPWSGDSPGVRH